MMPLLREGCAARTACRYKGETFASSQKRNAVPPCTADAPNANAAATPLGSPMPPAAIGDDRYLHCIDNLWHRAMVPTCASILWRRNVPRCPPAIQPLSDDGIATGLLKPLRLLDGGRRRHDLRAGLAHTLKKALGRKAEVEADDLRCDLFQKRAMSISECR